MPGELLQREEQEMSMGYMRAAQTWTGILQGSDGLVKSTGEERWAKLYGLSAAYSQSLTQLLVGKTVQTQMIPPTYPRKPSSSLSSMGNAVLSPHPHYANTVISDIIKTLFKNITILKIHSFLIYSYTHTYTSQENEKLL